jgi:hypothetical protein
MDSKYFLKYVKYKLKYLEYKHKMLGGMGSGEHDDGEVLSNNAKIFLDHMKILYDNYKTKKVVTLRENDVEYRNINDSKAIDILITQEDSNNILELSHSKLEILPRFNNEFFIIGNEYNVVDYFRSLLKLFENSGFIDEFKLKFNKKIYLEYDDNIDNSIKNKIEDTNFNSDQEFSNLFNNMLTTLDNKQSIYTQIKNVTPALITELNETLYSESTDKKNVNLKYILYFIFEQFIFLEILLKQNNSLTIYILNNDFQVEDSDSENKKIISNFIKHNIEKLSTIYSNRIEKSAEDDVDLNNKIKLNNDLFNNLFISLLTDLVTEWKNTTDLNRRYYLKNLESLETFNNLGSGTRDNIKRELIQTLKEVNFVSFNYLKEPTNMEFIIGVIRMIENDIDKQVGEGIKHIGEGIKHINDKNKLYLFGGNIADITRHINMSKINNNNIYGILNDDNEIKEYKDLNFHINKFILDIDAEIDSELNKIIKKYILNNIEYKNNFNIFIHKIIEFFTKESDNQKYYICNINNIESINCSLKQLGGNKIQKKIEEQNNDYYLIVIDHFINIENNKITTNLINENNTNIIKNNLDLYLLLRYYLFNNINFTYHKEEYYELYNETNIIIINYNTLRDKQLEVKNSLNINTKEYILKGIAGRSKTGGHCVGLINYNDDNDDKWYEVNDKTYYEKSISKFVNERYPDLLFYYNKDKLNDLYDKTLEPIGLANQDNTCWFNALNQNLLRMKPFTNLFEQQQEEDV